MWPQTGGDQLLNLSRFYDEWFGIYGGREILLTYCENSRDRLFIRAAEELEDYVSICRRFNSPAYVSVQPYKARDQPLAIEKLFFEFDCPEDPQRAWADAKTLADSIIRYYDAVPLVKFSGRKGYHLDVWLREAVMLDGAVELGKAVYKYLQVKILMGLKLPTLDLNVVGDLKRLERVPYSVHEGTGLLCQPVDLDGKPSPPEKCNISEYRKSGLSTELLRDVLKEVREEDGKSIVQKAIVKADGRVRLCIQAALNQPLEGGNGHSMRLATAIELLNAGYTVDEVVSLFKSQPDFNPGKTRYYVEHALKRGYKPFKCSTIRRLGYCLGSSCSFYKKQFGGP